MPWWSRWFRRPQQIPPAPDPESASSIPLPILVHTHAKGTVFPGILEDGIVELEQDDLILHAVAGIVQPDGTIGDLPGDRMEWARRLVYVHLKREGCLEEFGIPIIPAYEQQSER
jgi:hypothetical protein